MRPAPSIILHDTSLESLNSGDSFLQSGFWGQFKKRHGWTPMAFSYMEGETPRRLLVLYRKIFKIMPIAYVPHGPEISPDTDKRQLLTDMARELQGYLPMGTLFTRFDLPFGSIGKDNYPESLPGKLTKAPLDIQPPDTTILDLTPTPDDILAGMHKKTRYNIRLAGKKGVTVRCSSPGNFEQDFDAWYDMYRITSERDRIALHKKSYYRDLFFQAEQSDSAPQLKLWLAEHEGDLLAGIITGYYGKRATYIYGASSNEKRSLMPSYLLQWEAIQDARKAGCTSYDMFGIPPSDDPNHPMHGLYRFKTGFGGEIYHNHGAWDFPYSWSIYPFYKAAEWLRKWYYKTFRKR